MESIKKLPAGKVIAKAVFYRADYLLEILKIRHGSRVSFVERISRSSKVMSFRKTEPFGNAALAQTWFREFKRLKLENEKYVLKEEVELQ